MHFERGKFIGPIIWICRPLFSMEKSIVPDSSFCVENGIVALTTKGVYSLSLIKKLRYLSNSVPGGLVNRNFT